MQEPADSPKNDKPTEAPAKPITKREKYGSNNPFMPDLPSDFVNVPAPEGKTRGADGKGLFGKGNKYQEIANWNAAKKRAAFQKEITAAVTMDDIKQIVLALVDRAKHGDLACAQEIFNRTAGKVTDKIEVEGADGTGWTFTLKVREPEPEGEDITIIDVTPPMSEGGSNETT